MANLTGLTLLARSHPMDGRTSDVYFHSTQTKFASHLLPVHCSLRQRRIPRNLYRMALTLDGHIPTSDNFQI